MLGEHHKPQHPSASQGPGLYCFRDAFSSSALQGKRHRSLEKVLSVPIFPCPSEHHQVLQRPWQGNCCAGTLTPMTPLLRATNDALGVTMTPTQEICDTARNKRWEETVRTSSKLIESYQTPAAYGCCPRVHQQSEPVPLSSETTSGWSPGVSSQGQPGQPVSAPQPKAVAEMEMEREEYGWKEGSSALSTCCISTCSPNEQCSLHRSW